MFRCQLVKTPRYQYPLYVQVSASSNGRPRMVRSRSLPEICSAPSGGSAGDLHNQHSTSQTNDKPTFNARVHYTCHINVEFYIVRVHYTLDQNRLFTKQRWQGRGYFVISSAEKGTVFLTRRI